MIASRKLKVPLPLLVTIPKHKTFESYLQENYDPFYRILRMLADTVHFDFEVIPQKGGSDLLPNGSWTGVIGMLNRSEVDMTTVTLLVTEERREAVHFTYPFRLSSVTFVIEKPEYSPQIFGLAKALTLPVWIALAIFITAMVILNFMIMKQKYSFSDVFLHVLAICLGQSSAIKPWTSSQNVLTCGWIAGTMFLSFCYSSVLLSFLTFPAVLEIKDIPSLVRALEKNGYNCMFESTLPAGPPSFLTSNSKYLQEIGKNLLSNANGMGTFEDFFRLKKEKIAFFTLLDFLPFLPNGFFVSQDYILERIGGMAVRKDFCCKRKLDETVLRIMAGGLYLKVKQDSEFLSGLKYQSEGSKESSERKLTLKDFFLPFMILIIGHTFSVLVLISENFLCFQVRKKKKNRKRIFLRSTFETCNRQNKQKS